MVACVSIILVQTERLAPSIREHRFVSFFLIPSLVYCNSDRCNARCFSHRTRCFRCYMPLQYFSSVTCSDFSYEVSLLDIRDLETTSMCSKLRVIRIL